MEGCVSTEKDEKGKDPEAKIDMVTTGLKMPEVRRTHSDNSQLSETKD